MSAAENTRLPQALHEHYSFLTPAARRLPRAPFVEQVRDVAAGLALCLELIHSSNIDRLTGAAVPILGENDTERLTLFAIASARLLEQNASSDIQFMNEAAQKREAP